MFRGRTQAIKYNTVWRLVVLPLIVMAVVTVAVPAVTAALVGYVIPTHGALVSLSGAIAGVIGFLISLFIIVKTSKLKLADIGLSKKGAIRSSIIGAVAGVIALSLVAFATLKLGGVTIENIYKPEFLLSSTGILVGMLFFMFQGSFEELVFRAYLMPHFAKKMGIVWAIIVSSVLFTLIHALNPGITVMSIVNLIIASFVFSLIYYIWGNLWLAGLAHGAWNYAQGFIFGSLVSGLHLGQTVFVSTPVEGKILLSGGNYGFEGSVITTAFGIVLIIVLGIVARRKTVRSSTEPTTDQ